MRPEANAQRLLSVTRAKAKMFEFDVPLEYHIALPQRPELLFSLAVGLLGDAAAAIAEGERIAPREETTAESLLFAATYFESYIESRLNGEVSIDFSVLGAAAYYLADNPGSAVVTARGMEPPPVALGSGLALLVYRLILSNYDAIGPTVYGAGIDNVLAAMSSYLRGTDSADDALSVIQAVRQRAYLDGDGRELLYADIATAIVRKKIDNSARTVLPNASGLPLDHWLPALGRVGFPRELWPSQRRICAAGVLRGESAIIQMPTSAGKTRATELILRSVFLRDRAWLAVIVCPFRSLCHDIRGDMARAFAGENVVLNEATDSFQQDLDIEDLWERRTILIVTPEKLLYLLRRTPELAQHIGLVIYDEGHQFDSGARGVTYELLLTSLKLSLAEQTQIVLISAVIANAGKIAGWLIDNEGAVVDGAGLMPTARRVAFASWQTPLGRLEYVSPFDPDDTEFFVPRVIDRVSLRLLPRERAPRYFPQAEDGTSIGLYLGLKLCTNDSVAIFCGRKDTVVKICEIAVDLFQRSDAFTAPVDESNPGEVEKLATLFAQHVGEDAPATQAARIGIFPHHASVPGGLRLAIEHGMKIGDIRFVVCTSTLAQGVNLPIRYLIVTGVYQGGDRMLVRDFHNLIGRAGRAGMHTEGSIIFADTKVFDKRRQARERWRWRTAGELLDASNSEPSASSISAIFQPFEFGQPTRTITLNSELLQALVFDDETAVDASVAEAVAANPGLDARRFRRYLQDRVQIVHGIASFLLAHLEFVKEGLGERAVNLAKNTLAHYLADETHRTQIETVFQEVAERLLEGAATEEMRATLRRSPLAPTTVNTLKTWLEANRATLTQALETRNLLPLISEIVLRYNRSTSITGLSDETVMPLIIERWVSGATFDAILRLLVERNIRIGGSNRFPKVEDAVALCESGLGYEGAMILATIVDLAEAGEGDLRAALALLQRQMKCGLTSVAELGFFEAGFADRVVAQTLAANFPDVFDRLSARLAVRNAAGLAREIVTRYPSYFASVLDELLA
ncbi:DEAD/DEAH box helicase [Afipia sp. DC4300-2b1]|uniref:DEAD/DEAH box helicase n=1 Tax=Afipia sp. DC4300-2b1 TaxID=2804672 RepID=UPI003CF3C71D